MKLRPAKQSSMHYACSAVLSSNSHCLLTDAQLLVVAFCPLVRKRLTARMAALSLTCKQCNASLKSVKEAQEHGEVTGHSQFEESTEPVSQSLR